MTKAIITVGMGFGDEGKGATVDYLCSKGAVGLVVRYSGGYQAGHNIETTNGIHHCFSQFGSGTFHGVPTYLGPKVIISLTALEKEWETLKVKGVFEPERRLIINSKCLVSTIYHRRMNQLRELSQKHGSCGMGIGEARSYELAYGNDAIRLEDVWKRNVLKDKLELLRNRFLIESQKFIDRVPADKAAEFTLDINTSIEANKLLEIRKKIGFISWDSNELPIHPQKVVFEAAQGILLDEWVGFHPYTTWSDVTPRHALEICEANNITDITTLGIVRSTTTRHGNGPLPTYSDDLTNRFPDKANPHNQWQGHFRVGHFDLPLFSYAVNAVGKLDGIVVNHLDQKVSKICTRYLDPNYNLKYNGPNLNHQEKLGYALKEVEEYSRSLVNLASFSEKEFLDILGSFAPVVITGRGPRATDRQTTPKGIELLG